MISSNNKSAETANKLKEWIADDVIPLEGKFVDGENADNWVNVLFGSNDDAPVIISMTDRRYSVKRSTRKLDEEIAKRVKADLSGPKRQVAAFFFHLLHRRVTMKVGEIYDNEDRKIIQNFTASSEDRFCREVAEDGWNGLATTWMDEELSSVRIAHHNGFVPSHTLNEVYGSYCKRYHLKACGPTKLAVALQKALPSVSKATIRLGPSQIKTRGWWGIPLDMSDSPGRPAKVIPLSTAAKCRVGTPSDHAGFSAEAT